MRSGPGSRRSNHALILYRTSSCPALCRASTSWFPSSKKDADGRHKAGHDESIPLGRLVRGLRLPRVLDDHFELRHGQDAGHAELADDKGRCAAEAEGFGLGV